MEELEVQKEKQDLENLLRSGKAGLFGVDA